MQISLAELARQLGAELHGDGDIMINAVQTLQHAQAGEISFLANPAYRSQLAETRASAVIVAPNMVEQAPCAVLVTSNPYLAFAKLTQLFDDRPSATQRIHPSAVIAETAQIGSGVSIGAHVVIGEHCRIGADSEIGANTVMGDYSVLGERCLLRANVTLYHNVRCGNHVRIHSGTVIGGDGFGFAPVGGKWEKIAQLGGVEIGDDVEIGANTCIDRGALGDTVIASHTILDNLIQIAHNVKVGEGTAIAACTGISGSAEIGKNCIIGGGAGINGHIQIADGVQLSGMASITGSITQPGVYASGTSYMPYQEWRKNVARFRQLDKLAKRVIDLEKAQKVK